MKTIFLCLLFSVCLFAQNISNNRLGKIVRLIVSNSPEISKYILLNEFENANRFGIAYQEIENKFFIASEFPAVDENTIYDFKITSLVENFSLLSISIPSESITKEYYLQDSFIVSKPFFNSRNWKTKDSNHFKFFISDETFFNDYSIEQLEKFVEIMFNELKFSEQQRNEIKQKKIYYFLCKDESEIQKVTGFATRGIYILAQDYIITTYSTHYHELIHFLINFRLNDLPIYTHPFLQEGLAVAFGGRGGLDVHTIFETGVFLVKSGFANYYELLNRKDFQNTDATISYPISGLYVIFLINQIGIDKFIELYKKYSTSKDLNLIDFISVNDLPSEEKWNLFIDSLIDRNPIKVADNVDFNSFNITSKSENYETYSNEEEYLFRIKDTLLLNIKKKTPTYKSKLFAEHFPIKKYNSEKYLIIANQKEISIYNLYSNNLIGKYVASFSIPPKEIKKKDGFYGFIVEKYLFEEELK